MLYYETHHFDILFPSQNRIQIDNQTVLERLVVVHLLMLPMTKQIYECIEEMLLQLRNDKKFQNINKCI
jgi:hypothetical protein